MAKRKKNGRDIDLFTPFSISLADKIDKFLSYDNSAREKKDFYDFTSAIFSEDLNAAKNDNVWKLLNYLNSETDFFYAPASTRYHGAHECGLIMHCLAVLSKCLRLAPFFIGAEDSWTAKDKYNLTVACVFHDLCKVNMYEQKSRNVKNEKTGVWEKVPCYAVREDYLAFGHGIESMLRIAKFINLPLSWQHAVRWHMGAYDNSSSDEYAYKKALSAYKEVLLLHTADMQAGVVDGA